MCLCLLRIAAFEFTECTCAHWWNFVHICTHACVCVCMYVCMFVCMYVCMYACLPVCLCAFLPVCMCGCMVVCMCKRLLANEWSISACGERHEQPLFSNLV